MDGGDWLPSVLDSGIVGTVDISGQSGSRGGDRPMRVLVRVLLVAGGMGALAWFLSRADLREIGRAVGELGWAVPALLVPYFAVYLADATGWWFAFPRRCPVTFARL